MTPKSRARHNPCLCECGVSVVNGGRGGVVSPEAPAAVKQKTNEQIKPKKRRLGDVENKQVVSREEEVRVGKIHEGS